ncbi:MAG: hypothetical protein K2K25_06405 [Muribaculaceae bacterium]|nr:hypothetical protein [Muribaculaceae bacterium]
MKKFFTLSVAFAVCASLSAETVKIFRISEGGIPGLTEPELYGTGISPNGNYFCGVLPDGVGVFIGDTRSGDIKFQVFDSEDGGELRAVDNNGLGIGFETQGITYSFASDKISMIETPDTVKTFIGEDLTPDGSFWVGSFSQASFSTMAVCKKADGDWNILPMPTKEDLGGYAGKVRMESAAKEVSDDGKYILGNIGGFGAPILWVRNDKGEYEVDFFPSRYVKLEEKDIADDSKPFYAISGMYGYCLSDNGKYVAFLALMKDADDLDINVAAVYDTQTKEVKIYNDYQEIDELGLGLYPQAIANDGTFIGCVGKPIFGSSGAFIMKAGSSVAESFNNAFPEFYEKLGETDMLGYNVPTGISADGSKILGYTFYADDFYSAEGDAYYETYMIDRSEELAVGEIPSSSVAPESIYSIDGRRLQSLSKGINIVRNADGTTSKILK